MNLFKPEYIGGAFAALSTIAGGIFGLFKWLSSRLDERLQMQIAEAVTMATAEMNADLVQVRERVAILETHWGDAKEDIQEIKGKLDMLGGHMVSLPARIAEALKR